MQRTSYRTSCFHKDEFTFEIQRGQKIKAESPEFKARIVLAGLPPEPGHNQLYAYSVLSVENERYLRKDLASGILCKRNVIGFPYCVDNGGFFTQL